MREPTATTESAAALRQMRDDAERYRFWRRIFLRRVDRQPGGNPIYTTVLETPVEIDADEFDRILDAARGADDGAKTTFTAGFLPDAPAPAPKSGALPPVQCHCGAVRPPTRGRRPAEWTCESCLAGGVRA